MDSFAGAELVLTGCGCAGQVDDIVVDAADLNAEAAFEGVEHGLSFAGFEVAAYAHVADAGVGDDDGLCGVAAHLLHDVLEAFA